MSVFLHVTLVVEYLGQLTDYQFPEQNTASRNHLFVLADTRVIWDLDRFCLQDSSNIHGCRNTSKLGVEDLTLAA